MLKYPQNEHSSRLLDLGLFPLAFFPARGEIGFPDSVPAVEPAVRRREDMKDVLLDPAGPGPNELYFMYRGVSRSQDKEAIEAAGLRFDITVIMPGRIGRELIKTAGHYHPPVPGHREVTYPELYEVLSGRAHYLIQKPGKDGRGAGGVGLIPAETGDKVLIPPNYGHITINAGEEPLVMANWVARDFQSVYDAIKDQKGGAYFEIFDPRIGYRFLPNHHYEQLPPIVLRPILELSELGINQGTPSYQSFFQDPGKFSYLTEPHRFIDLFQAYLGNILTL